MEKQSHDGNRRPEFIDLLIPWRRRQVGDSWQELLAPSVITDKLDYRPGETAMITASGFRPGETITFTIADDPQDPGDDGDADLYQPFSVTDGGAGDLDGKANGQVVTTWFVPTDDDGSGSGTPDALNASLILTALGSKGQTAQVLFTDSGASVVTDKADYAPGETVTITASGFAAESTITFTLTDDPSDPGDDGEADVYEPFAVTDGGEGDLDGLANGQVVTTWLVPTDNNGSGLGTPDALNGTLKLTASGSDGEVASTSFTDANNASVNIDQWANGPLDNPVPADYTWQNGNLNPNQANYFEGESVAYRADLNSLLNGATYYLTIAWDTTEGGRHALDYLTTWDRSFALSDPNYPYPLQAPPPSGGFQFDPPDPTENKFIIPVDPLVAAGRDGIPETSDDITQAEGYFTLRNGTILGYLVDAGPGNVVGDDNDNIWSGEGDDNPYRISGTYAGASQTQLTVIFTYTGTTGTDAALLWGGHIASRSDWGKGSSAGAISGSPYHMRFQDPLPPLDGASGTDPLPSGFYSPTDSTASTGQQDRSLSSAVVIIPASITVVKDAIPNSETSFDYEFTRPANTVDVIDGKLDLTGDLTITVDDDGRFVAGGITYTVADGLITSGPTTLDGYTIISGGLNVNNSGTSAGVIDSADDLSNLTGVGTVTFSLADSGSGTAYTKTFGGLVDFVAGYQVKELPEPGWNLTNTTTLRLDINGVETSNTNAPNPTLITLAEGDSWTATYTNKPTPPTQTNFQANKFLDSNADGIWQKLGESGIANWQISVYADDDIQNGMLDQAEFNDPNNLILSAFTDSAGDIPIITLSTGPGGAAAHYIVVEEAKSPYIQSAPAGFDVVNPGPTGIEQLGYAVTVKDLDGDGLVEITINGQTYGDNGTTIPVPAPTFDFGNYQNADIVVKKYLDKNANGSQEAGEEFIADWTFSVDLNKDGDTTDEGESKTIIDAAAGVTFSAKPGTSYTVIEDMTGKTGWFNSDPGGNPPYDKTTGQLVSGDSETLFFGNYENADIIVKKYLDANANGAKDAEEIFITDWSFSVDLNKDGDTTDEGESKTIIDAAAGVTFSAKPGTSYTVIEDMTGKTGWFNSDPGGNPPYDKTTGQLVSGDSETLFFGNYENADIIVKKYLDANANGAKDAEEIFITDWSFSVDLNKDGDTTDEGESKTIIDAAAGVTFSAKPGTSYTVIEDMTGKTGWFNSDPGGNPPYDKTTGQLVSGDSETLIFGNYENADIIVKKYLDANANGAKDAEEIFITDWSFSVDLNKDGDTTDEGESKTIIDAAAGVTFSAKPGTSYTVIEDMTGKTGWFNSDPGGNPPYDKTTGQLVSGDSETLFFGNYENADIIVKKYLDANANGAKDAEEIFITDWSFSVDLNKDGDTTDEGESKTIIDAAAGVTFSAKPGTSYTVIEDMTGKTGWFNSDPGGNPPYDKTTGQLVSGDSETLFFGNYENADIIVKKYLDANANGAKDAEEIFITDWSFSVDLNKDGDTTDEGESKTIIDAAAGVTFSAKPGTSYTVIEDMTGKTGWFNSDPGGNPPYDKTTGQLVSGDSETLFFGNYENADIIVKKYLDANANGAKDAEEIFITDWSFSVDLNKDGDTTDEGESKTIIDAAAGVTFSAKPGTSYTVIEDMTGKTGWFNSDPGGNPPYDKTTGQLVSGDSETLFFGNYENADIIVKKYLDANANGAKDAEEIFITDWSFSVDLNKDGDTTDEGESKTIIDAAAGVTFSAKPGTSYTVIEDMTGKTGWFNSDPGGNPPYDKTTGQLVSGDSETLFFGNYENADIIVKKYLDANANGAKDAEEIFITDWSFSVDLNKDGDTTDEGESKTIIDAAAGVTFSAKPGTSYTVIEDMTGKTGWFNSDPGGQPPYDKTTGQLVSGGSETLFFGNYENADIIVKKYLDANANGAKDAEEIFITDWSFSVDLNKDGDTTDEGESKTIIDAAAGVTFSAKPGTSYTVIEDMTGKTGWFNSDPGGNPPYDKTTGQLVSGDSETLFFGNYENADIIVKKYLDANANGAKDAEEIFITDWSFSVDLNKDGDTTDEGESKTIIDAAAGVTFSAKPGTSYTVIEDMTGKTGWFNSDPGGNPPYDKTTGQLVSGDSETLFFGNYVNGSIHGFKFDDTNGDGVFNGSDTAQAGVVFTLSGNGITPIADTTDASGYFEFTNLKPGDYAVTETPPSADTVATVDHDGNGIGDFITTVTIASGQEKVAKQGQAGTLPSYQSEVVVGNQLTFGNFEEKICALTPGFWSQHIWAWDGNPNTDGPVDKQGRTLASKLVAAGTLTKEDMLIDGATGLKLDNRLFFSLKDSQDIINASNKLINDDQRVKLARHAIATQLNDFNGAPNPNNILKDATDWLTGTAPYTYPDGSTGDVDTNGTADFNNTIESGPDGFAGTKLAANKQAWQGYPAGTNAGSEVFNALVAYNENCNGVSSGQEKLLFVSNNEADLIVATKVNSGLGLGLMAHSANTFGAYQNFF